MARGWSLVRGAVGARGEHVRGALQGILPGAAADRYPGHRWVRVDPSHGRAATSRRGPHLGGLLPVVWRQRGPPQVRVEHGRGLHRVQPVPLGWRGGAGSGAPQHPFHRRPRRGGVPADYLFVRVEPTGLGDNSWSVSVEHDEPSVHHQGRGPSCSMATTASRRCANSGETWWLRWSCLWTTSRGIAGPGRLGSLFLLDPGRYTELCPPTETEAARTSLSSRSTPVVETRTMRSPVPSWANAW